MRRNLWGCDKQANPIASVMTRARMGVGSRHTAAAQAAVVAAMKTTAVCQRFRRT
jgi:hypothetical protein